MAGREPVRINLVEQDGWKKYDFASGKLDWAVDSAWDDFKAMSKDTLEALIDDLWGSSPGKGKRKPSRRLSSQELQYLAMQVKELDDVLEPVRRAIVDASQWMYELAAIPNDDDIKDAMATAREEFEGNPEMNDDLWEPILMSDVRRGPKEWRPRLGRFTRKELIQDLLGTISFEREKGQWDRYIEFFFWRSLPAQELLRRNPSAEEELDAEFRNMRGNYLSDFWKALSKEMENVDIYNRADWRLNWKSMLSDGSVVSEAQNAIRKVLAEMPKEESYDA